MLKIIDKRHLLAQAQAQALIRLLGLKSVAMALNDMFKQLVPAVGMDLERPASRRRLRDGSASNGDQSAQKADQAHLR